METPFPPFEPHGGSARHGAKIRDIPLRLMLPNLITVLAICAGLSGIRLAFEGRFEIAVVMVLLAAFLDGIDGRLARMLKATSKFGEQMDSLADIVNFGAAPALVLYAYMLDRAGSLGWTAALLFAIACGLRLARFNVQIAHTDKPAWMADYFTGVPAPAGAVLVMLPVYLGFLGLEANLFVVYAACAYTVIVAVLLVSTLPVFSGKSSSSKVRGDVVFPLILVAVFYVLMLFSFTWQTMTATAIAYLAFLPFSVKLYARRLQREKRDADMAKSAEPETAEPPKA
ncbi:MAG: phosphatidylcholine/phosphatidylserine synthase [Mesorhizobium sp.]|nr:phosphatidylcholine/phosphatidylserine synthase [Mesorhizobium sp.]MCO5159748.1 phosphatidylcholine/phosphatidylserine synthase [Mesorhizobium sp.]